MGFFDKLFGGKAASETKFSGQKMTVMLPIDGKAGQKDERILQ